MLKNRIRCGVCAIILCATTTQSVLNAANVVGQSLTDGRLRLQSHQPRQFLQLTQITQNAPALAASSVQTQTLVYLPLVMRNYPLQTIFGIETLAPVDAANGLPKLLELGATFVRRNALLWADVEPTEGARNWSAVASIEQDLKNASASGLQPILIIRGVPTWAKRDANSDCGPVKQTKFAAFATFAHDVAARYKDAPYNLKYIELFNEPDAQFNTVETVYGCWGDTNDPYFGGGYYADMLKVAYPKIKEANPNAKVLNGGLLLDNSGSKCPSTTDPFACAGRFFEGMLKNGGGNFFDGLSYHAYDFYAGNGNYVSSQFPGSNSTTGPVVIAKTRFLKGMMSKYGVTGKLLFNTETGLIWYQTPPPTLADFEDTKARYVPQVYAAALAEGVYAQAWFCLQGWFGSGLLDPAYPQTFNAFKFMTKEVADAKFVRAITQFEGVMAYELDRGDKKIWIVWSMNNAPKTITLSSTPLAKFDLYGAASTPSASLIVNGSPVYLEWAP